MWFHLCITQENAKQYEFGDSKTHKTKTKFGKKTLKINFKNIAKIDRKGKNIAGTIANPMRM